MLVDIHTARKHLRERKIQTEEERGETEREKSVVGSSCLWLITVSN